MTRFLAIFLALHAAADAATNSAMNVTFDELIRHPRKYDGKRVSVRAYVVTSCHHCGEFWASVQAARDSRVHDSPVQQCIAIGELARGFSLPRWFNYRLMHENYDGYVHVTGRFEYQPLRRHVVHQPARPPRPASEEAEREIVEVTVGFGWMGLDDKRITNITEYRPIGPPVPAQIN